MLFRALFWIAVVAILMPREPDLGLGRPGTAFARVDARFTCRGYGKTCTNALGALDTFQSIALRNLAHVKAEIEADKRMHGSD